MAGSFRRLAAALSLGMMVAGTPGGARAPTDVPRAAIRIDGVDATAEFHVIGDKAVLSARLPDGSVSGIRILNDVSDALAVLADERLSFARPALLAWAGSDLSILRDAALARSRVAAAAGIVSAIPKGQNEQWTGNGPLTSTLQFSRILASSGRADEAIAILRTAIVQAPVKPDANDPRPFLAIRLAAVLFEYGAPEAAVDLLDKASQDATNEPDLKLNIDVNLAQFLARTGHYQRALLLIDAAWKQFQVPMADDELSSVPDSAAQFAWIKACALDGLGRHEQARALIAGISSGPPRAWEIPVPAKARLGAFICMHDSAGLADEFQAQLASARPGSDLFTALQPASYRFAPDAETVAAALRRPALAKAMAGRVRSLDPQFAAALRDWQAGSNATKPS